MKRILIVEDNPEMQQIYKRMFEDKSDKYEIKVVGDARVAFKALETDGFDLVLLDIIMEPMDGETFFHCVRSNNRGAEIPIIIISVLGLDSLEHLEKINHVDFLQKPITKDQLFDIIKKKVGE